MAEFQVNTYTNNNQINPAVAMDADGDFIISWTSNGQDGSGYGVYAQRYNSAGVAVGGEFQVNTNTNGNQVNSTVAIDATGDFVISWQTSGQDGSGFGIYAQRYNSSGVAIGGEFQVNTSTNNDQVNPTIAMDATGNFVISWQSSGQDGSGDGIYAQCYNNTGVAQGGEFQVNTYTDSFQYNPTVAMDADGDFVISWTSFNQDGSDNGIYARRYNRAGQAQGGEFQVNSDTDYDQTNSTVAIDADGDFVISWQSYNYIDGYGFEIYAQRYNSLGVAQGSNFKVNTNKDNDQVNPTVAIDADGDFVISWQSYGQDRSSKEIYAQRYNSAGVAIGSEFQVNTNTDYDQVNPTVAIDTDGNFVISWQSYSQDGFANGIYAQRYNNNIGVPPTITSGSASALGYTENATTAIDSAITVSDTDSTNLVSATISITSGFVSGQDTLNFTNQNGITGSYNSSTGVLTLIGSATIADYQTALRSITYTNSSDNPTTTPRTASFLVNDGTADSTPTTRDINITAVNDAPVATATNSAIAYTENATTAIDSAIIVSDTDSANLSSATISISSGFVFGQDSLAFINQNGITGSYNSSTGVLTLTGSSTVANYQTALRSITYTNSSDNPSLTPRTISFIVNDGAANSTAITRDINITAINDAPVATATSSALAYTENTTTAIDSGITVSDLDSPNLASATVSITSGFTSAEDILAFTNQNGIIGSYNSSTGVLTLTGSSTVANYQTALRSIIYTNSSDNPSTTPRTVSFLVNDGTANSSAVTRNINITAINDAPVATATSSALAYTENTTTAIDSGITVSDLDSPNLASATVSITSGFTSAEDILAFTNQNGIIGSYNSSTGVLTLTGSSTVANYQTALRSIIYTNSSDNPSTTPRTVSFLVNDGTANSSAVTRNINITAVNDAPVATVTNSALTYTENATTAIDSGITISDVDSANLASATVSITSGFVSAQDTLAFINQNGITGSYNSSTGVLTLTGSATVANYQTALRSITYTNSSDNPSTTPRTVSFLVNDGTANSTAVTRNINITVVNDAPVAVNDSFTTNKNTPVIISATTLLSNDIDVDVSDVLSITGFTQPSQGSLVNNNNGTYTYTPGQNYYGSDGFTYTISDGHGGSSTATVNLTINQITPPINGTSGADTLTGTMNMDIISGLQGNDTLQGLGDNDTLDGGDGNDSLDGGAGADSLIGGKSNDTYIVDNLSDSITEGLNAGTDLVKSSVSWVLGNNLENLTLTGSGAINGTGNSLKNILIGNTGANILSGENGNDNLFGDSGNDTLLGGAGNDTLDGGLGADSLNGGMGNDTYIVDNLNDSIIEGLNAGTDLVKSSVNWVLGNNLENLTLTGSGAINGTGNSLKNILIGNTGANILNGEDGNDSLIGGAGNDTLFGGAGDDTLDGGLGSDSLVGGAGNDIYIVDNVNDVISEGLNAGTDLVKSSVSCVLADNLENLTLTGSKAINGTGNSLNNILIGNTGANILSGGDGNDSLFGNSGNDTLLGGAGDDTLNGGAGTDSLDGGVGNDIYTVDNLNDSIIEDLDAGIDFVNSSVNWVLGNNLENLTLTGTGTINGTGNILNNILMGNNAANTLTGGDGNDSLFGNSGNDTLFGGAGDDLIAGGVGRDVLTGGTGQDSFNLTGSRTGGYDTIADFTLGEDTILISKAEFGLVQSQNTTLDSGLFRLGTSAIAGSDRFIYDQTTGNLFFDADGIGKAAQVQIAQFSNHVVLSSANITVIA
ncbi:beta strand repeat-containing protein [Nostoc sp.]|uniref:beta strand repeat-containing protein n=1 Tax=Nostoc sp. TaxID=1180 RepID=UPI002FF85733